MPITVKSTRELVQSFDKYASQYEKYAAVQLEIGRRLFERLNYLKLAPRYILDAGCATGYFAKSLKHRYPQAEIVGLDLAHAMLQKAKLKQGFRKKWGLVNADMHHMPFADGQFDLIFSNQVIHWSKDLQSVLKEFNRVLRPGGCLLFSTVGPDTFQELRQAFQQVDTYAHVNAFHDMHHIGDCLLAELFDDPVVDMEMITAHYPSLNDLLRSIKSQGVKNIHEKRNMGLTGKHSWHKFSQYMANYMMETAQYPLTYEVVYGHGWKSQQHRARDGVETTISLASLRASLAKRL